MKPLHSKTDLFQIAKLLVHTLKEGTITLKIDGVENIQLQIENNKLNLNFIQKEELKTLLELQAEIKEESILKKLQTLKNLAEQLKQEGSTITVSYKGQTLLTLGCEAKPTLSQIATRTNAIEINNLIELMKLAT